MNGAPIRFIRSMAAVFGKSKSRSAPLPVNAIGLDQSQGFDHFWNPMNPGLDADLNSLESRLSGERKPV
jgi:hypothetical protein